MNKEFIPYEQALELKELGFNEPCAAKYNKGSFQNNSLGTWNDYNDSTWGLSLISAPLYQQAFRWFREKYGLLSFIDNLCLTDTFKYSINWEDSITSLSGYSTYLLSGHSTYEEAELACLKKLIEIAKQK